MKKKIVFASLAAFGLAIFCDTSLAGGAKIVIRQRMGVHQCYGGGASAGNPVLNRALDVGEAILLDRFGGNTSRSTTGLPPATRTPTPDPAIANVIKRLDALSPRPTPNTTINHNPVPRTRGGGGTPLPPIPTTQPGFFPE